MYPHAARHFLMPVRLRNAARVECGTRTNKSWIFG